MKKTRITSLDQLIEIFPSLTQAQIIDLYLSALKRVKHLDCMAGKVKEKEKTYDIMDKLSFYTDCAEFLAGYLARCYCELCGFTAVERL